ncbi:hypothetical protein ACIBF5_09505 [Micromonospora sp. NPDC050417]|uniref:hypothetical protein n=1 Tax=Micromonospora sp. NPDC050417 TaxID=3364280 RepID=UPI0037A46019
MSLSARLNARLTGRHSTPLDLGSANYPLSAGVVVDLVDGTGAGQADRLFTDRRTIVASGTDALDLAGVLVDAFGAVITMARVKALYVAAAATNVNNLLVGGAAANTWTSWAGAADNEIVIRPGGALLLVAPDAVAYPVTAGTADQLQIANSGSGSSVTYDIVIIGASA